VNLVAAPLLSAECSCLSTSVLGPPWPRCSIRTPASTPVEARLQVATADSTPTDALAWRLRLRTGVGSRTILVGIFSAQTGGPGGAVLNSAVTAVSASIVNEHVPVPEHGPLQPANVDPAAGVAVSVTAVPAATVSEHAPGQVIPEPLTVPDPLPASVTVSVGCCVNVAVTVVSALSCTWQLAVPEQPPPDQPANVDPAAGWRSA